MGAHLDPEAILLRLRDLDLAFPRLKILDQPRATVKDMEIFRRVVGAAFATRRKTLRNSFSTLGPDISKERVIAALIKTGIDPGQRAETVTVFEFAALANLLAGEGAVDA